MSVRELRITVADVAAVATVAWFGVAGSGIYELTALCGVWLTVRNIDNSRYPMWLIAAGAMSQVVVCALQMCGAMASNHSMFRFTGSFFNPGPLAGFLACSLFIYVSLQKRWMWIVAAATLFFVVCAESRAAWLAALAGMIVCLWPRLKKWLPVLAVCAVVTCVGLYLLRPRSADGRLLIWRASMGLVAEAPVAGNGAGSFEREYMYHQADYLSTRLDTEEAVLADNVVYAFSEPVRILCEYGVVGLMICGVFVVLVVVAGRGNKPVLAAFVAWLVFGLFSYPSDILVMRVLFAILAATLARGSRTAKVLRFNRTAVMAVAIAMMGMIAFVHRDDTDELYAHAAELLRGNRYEEAIPLFERIETVAPSSQLLVDLGKCYDHAGRSVEAEQALTTAVYMTPGYVTPVYELFDFYRRAGRTIEARHWADYILTHKFKAVGSTLLFARKEARRSLLR